MMRGRWLILALVLAVFLLWNTPGMLPLKILVVFFHELSHAMAAVLSGGKVVSISLSPEQGGLTITRGGSLFWVTTAGYIGSLLIGVALFLLAVRGRRDRAVMAALGATLLLVAALYMRESFALLFSVVTGVAMLGSARYFNAKTNDAVLRVIGLTSMGYVPYDILSDTILRSSVGSDAESLARQFGGAPWFWGGVWLLVSLAVIWWAMRKGLRL